MNLTRRDILLVLCITCVSFDAFIILCIIALGRVCFFLAQSTGSFHNDWWLYIPSSAIWITAVLFATQSIFLYRYLKKDTEMETLNRL